MTAHFWLISRRAGAHRAPLQLRIVTWFTFAVTFGR
jgi:hypothetical protein